MRYINFSERVRNVKISTHFHKLMANGRYTFAVLFGLLLIIMWLYQLFVLDEV